jgi:C-terminal processing protease CtpA/Prc
LATLFRRFGDRPIKGFVIDMRNNPGELFDQAISVSNAFLDKGEIVSSPRAGATPRRPSASTRGQAT